MKTLLLLLCLVCGPVFAQNNVLVKNNWTNAVMVSYQDTNNASLTVYLPAGAQFNSVSTVNAQGTGFQVVTIYDPASWDTNTSGYDQSVNVTGDGTTNDMIIQVTCSPQYDYSNYPQVKVTWALQAVVYQYPQATAQYASAVSGAVSIAGLTIPPLSCCINYWFWGLCTAIILGLSGASRRLLGRVHEVNTDI